MYKFFQIVIGILLSTNLHAQQLPNWSSFYENGFVWNPALTAKWNYWDVSATHRQDWTGFDDAPQYSTIGFQFPIVRRITKTSFGGFLEQDKVGPYSKIGISATYVYKFHAEMFGNEHDVISLGLLANISSYRYSNTGLKPFDGFEGDLSLLDTPSNIISPNVGFGFFYNSVDNYIESSNHYYFGVSLNQLIPSRYTKHFIGNIMAGPHATLHAGYRFYSFSPSYGSDGYYIEPNFVAIYGFSKAINAMANVKFEMVDKYWASAGVVTNGEYFLQAGLIFDEYSVINKILNEGLFRLGVKADYSIGSLRRYAGIGYEIFMGYSYELD